MSQKSIAISVGDPAGIGSDIVIKLAQQQRDQLWFAIADPQILVQRATLLGLPLAVEDYNTAQAIATEAGKLTVLTVSLSSHCSARPVRCRLC